MDPKIKHVLFKGQLFINDMKALETLSTWHILLNLKNITVTKFS